jgi:hypothetical protein
MRCGGCGQSFEPRRRDQQWCTARCRHRGFARARVEAAQRTLAALEVLDQWVGGRAGALGTGGDGPEANTGP